MQDAVHATDTSQQRRLLVIEATSEPQCRHAWRRGGIQSFIKYAFSFR